MNNGQIPEEDYKKLYAAIVNAIGQSKDIRAIVRDLKERNKINSISMFALIIKLEELLNSSALPALSGLPVLKKREGGGTSSGKVEGEFIDGEKLSPNEAAFEKFYRKDFDEESWLKENRLIF